MKTAGFCNYRQVIYLRAIDYQVFSILCINYQLFPYYEATLIMRGKKVRSKRCTRLRIWGTNALTTNLRSRSQQSRKKLRFISQLYLFTPTYLTAH